MQNKSILYSPNNPCPFKTLIIHDEFYLAQIVSENLNSLGYPASYLDNAASALEKIGQKSISFEIFFIHNDLGWNDSIEFVSNKLVETIHRLNPMARIIMLSGNFPKGRDEMLKLGIDGYSGSNQFDEINPWGLVQIEKGPLNAHELTLRGKELLMGPADPTINLRWKER